MRETCGSNCLAGPAPFATLRGCYAHLSRLRGAGEDPRQAVPFPRSAGSSVAMMITERLMKVCSAPLRGATHTCSGWAVPGNTLTQQVHGRTNPLLGQCQSLPIQQLHLSSEFIPGIRQTLRDNLPVEYHTHHVSILYGQRKHPTGTDLSSHPYAALRWGSLQESRFPSPIGEGPGVRSLHPISTPRRNRGPVAWKPGSVGKAG